MVQTLETHSTNLAKKQHLYNLNQEMLSHKEQLGNITDALPIIRRRVSGIDQTIQKLSSILPKGKKHFTITMDLNHFPRYQLLHDSSSRFSHYFHLSGIFLELLSRFQ